MKKVTVQLEIVLLPGNTSHQKQLCDKEFTKDNRSLSPLEQMEEACWNGLLPELFPELEVLPGNDRELILWQIRQSASLLQIKMSDSVISVDGYYSIDPSYFLPHLLAAS